MPVARTVRLYANRTNFIREFSSVHFSRTVHALITST